MPNGRDVFLVGLSPEIGLPVEEGLLGTSWPVSMSGLDTDWTMLLPSAPTERDTSGSGDLAPPGVVGARSDATHRIAGQNGWGGVQLQSPDAILVAVVNAVVMRGVVGAESLDVEDGGRQVLPTPMVEALEDWFARFVDWLEVLASAAYCRSERGAHELGHPYRQDESGALTFVGSGLRVQFAGVYRERLPLALATWADAVRRTGADRSPPDAHVRLRHATAALCADDYRTTVIDAATACEVALAEAIRLQLDQADEVSLEYMLSRGGVVEYYDTYCAVTGSVPTVSRGRLMNEVARVRNRAVHGGHAPHGGEATRSLLAARKLVIEVSPLDAESSE